MSYISFGSGKKNFVIIPGLSIHGVMGLAEQIASAYQEFAADYKQRCRAFFVKEI